MPGIIFFGVVVLQDGNVFITLLYRMLVYAVGVYFPIVYSSTSILLGQWLVSSEENSRREGCQRGFVGSIFYFSGFLVSLSLCCVFPHAIISEYAERQPAQSALLL